MALIYRSYYAMINNPLTSSKGLNTSAIYGFINSTLKLIKDENPSHIAIVLDTKAKTFRHELYDDYKATRKPMPNDLVEQLNPLYDIFDSLNIKIYKKDGFEADDILGTISQKLKTRNIEIYIYSSDKDLMQLVDNNVFIYSPGSKFSKSKIYNVNEVTEKWGVKPINIIDYLSLLGDTSDNVPGVPGVGKKTACKLINDYKTVENIYDSIDSITNPGIKKKLINSEKSAFLSKTLIKLDLNVNVDFNLDDMSLKNISFPSILDKLHDLNIYTFDKRINQNKSIDVDMKKNKKNYTVIDSESKLDSLIKKIINNDIISLDLETTSIDANQAEVVGVSLSFKKHTGYYIACQYPEQKNKKFNSDYVLNKLKEIFESGNIKFVGQNIKYDALILKRYGIKLDEIYFDTMIAESLISPEKNSYKLDILSLDYFNYKMIPIEDLIGPKKKQQITMQDVPIKDITFYACEDADLTLQLYYKQITKIKELNLENLFFNVEIPLINVLIEIEFNGVYVDVGLIKKLSSDIKIEIQQISQNIYNIAGKEFNLNSPLQLSKVLFDDLQLKKIRKKSTSVEVLEKLKNYHPIIDLILRYRHLSKLVNTYLDTLPTFVNPATNRVHTSFNQAIASTGRLSSNKPNFQNIPIKSPISKEIRKAFKVQDENNLIVSFDYSQIELRILAHFSDEKNLIEAFNKDIDIHSRTAALIYGLKVDEVNENHRRVAKIINYSIVYGAGPYRISQELKISMKEASNIINNYFQRYPGIKSYIEKIIMDGTKNEYVYTILGRRRNTLNLRSSNRNIVEAEKRAAINMPIQGSASELIKVAMNNIYKRMKDENYTGKMILQVHDELLFEIPRKEMEKLSKMVVEEMEKSISFKVPIKVDYNYGNNWYEAH